MTRTRRTARVLLIDPDGRILLLKGRLPSSPTAPAAWFTVGGGIEPGESVAEAARREIAEETGFVVDEISEPLWTNELTVHDRKGRPFAVHETFVLARCEAGEPSRDGWVALEREFVDDIAWFTLQALKTCPDDVWPHDLAARLEALLGSGAVQPGGATLDS